MPLNENKIMRLYVQAARQQWAADDALNFSQPIEMPEEYREIWRELATVFYTLEKMGLHVLSRMQAKAASKYHSDATMEYLTMQSADEGRHVYAIEKYLAALGAPPHYDRKFHVLGQVASLGFYRVENWLFSTLFSENFASSFLRRAKAAAIDPLGAEMCRKVLIDESRHLHFLHIALPDVLDRMSLFGRSYVRLSQSFIMNFTTRVTKTMEHKARRVGIERNELLDEVFTNVEKAYEGLGVTRDFLRFPRLSSH